MSIARDTIVFNGFLYPPPTKISHFACSILATQSSCSSTALKSYVSEAQVTLSDTFVKWLNSGPSAIQISSILFNDLPVGNYIVEAFSHTAISEAISGEYYYKTLFQAPLFVDSAKKPLSISQNTVSFPISINASQPTLNLIVRVSAYSLQADTNNFRKEGGVDSEVHDDPPSPSFATAAVFIRKSLA